MPKSETLYLAEMILEDKTMHIFDHPLYQEDIKRILQLPQMERLYGKHVVITGASGSIGSVLADALLSMDNPAHVYAIGRSENRMHQRFLQWAKSPYFHFIAGDLNAELPWNALPRRADYLVHAASNTHPVAYATDPIGTIATNITATQKLLEYAAQSGARFVFCSSVEIYGENRGDIERFPEKYCGYIDCNTLRAGYPESKRAGEALCQAYIRQKGVDAVIPRLARTYGPTLLQSDTKALTQFIRNSVAGQNIVLKSKGTQQYSYTYVSDAVGGLLTCMLRGGCGEAYNIADAASDVTLHALAEMLAEAAGTQVVYEIPDAVEQAGYSKATKAMMDAEKIHGLGWKAHYTIHEGLNRTVRILSELI